MLFSTLVVETGLNMLFIQKQSYDHPLKCFASHRVPKFQRSFCLTQERDWLRLEKFCRHQSTIGLILKVGLILKPSKITLRLIIG